MELARVLACVAAASAIALGARAAAPAPLEEYGKLPSAEQVKLSPDGQKIAFLGFEKGHRFIGARKIGGPLLVAFNAGDQKVRSIQWLDDHHIMVRVDAYLNSNINYGSGFIGGAYGTSPSG